MKKRAIGMGVFLGVPAVVVVAIFGGVATAGLFLVVLWLGLWWIVRHTKTVDTEPPSTP